MPGSVWLIRLITFYVIKRFSHLFGIEIENFIKSCTYIYFCTAFERLESSDVTMESLRLLHHHLDAVVAAHIAPLG
jgi:hypothetical protein